MFGFYPWTYIERHNECDGPITLGADPGLYGSAVHYVAFHRPCPSAMGKSNTNDEMTSVRSAAGQNGSQPKRAHRMQKKVVKDGKERKCWSYMKIQGDGTQEDA